MRIRPPRVIAAATFALVFSSSPTLPTTQAEPIAVHSLPDLEAQALQSLRNGYALLADPTLDASQLQLVGTVNESDRATVDIQGRIREITRFRAAALSYGTVITGADVRLSDVEVEVMGTKLLLRATEHLQLKFEEVGEGPRPENVTGQRLTHEFLFDLMDGTWVLTFDRPLWPESGRTSPDPQPASHPTLAHFREEGFGPGAKVMARPVGAWGTYNATAAVNYAHTYAGAAPSTGYNYPTYWYYAQDCANFMSQALRAGGWTDKSGNGALDNPNNWFYDNVYHVNTNTWSAADWLINFIYTSGRGYSLSAFTDLTLGDIMFADWGHNGTPGIPEHSMMLTLKTSNDYTNIRFSYHTTDRYDYPLSLILSGMPNSLYWGSRILYTSN